MIDKKKKYVTIKSKLNSRIISLQYGGNLILYKYCIPEFERQEHDI